MRVLIIGGTRLMGPYVARELLTLGHEVTVFHRGETEADLPADVHHVHGDRNHLNKYADEFKRFRPDVVLDMMLMHEREARELVEVMSGTATWLVVASSCDVYRQWDLIRGIASGTPTYDRLTEDSPLRDRFYPYRNRVTDADDPMYDYDKILVERIVMSSPDLPATVLRLPMVHGPHDHRHRFLGYIKRMADRRQAILIDPMEAEWRITRGYVANCAHAICRAITDPGAGGRIYNVGEPSALSQREWIERLAMIMAWNGAIVTLPQERLPKHLKSDEHWEHHLVVDTSRLRTGLGYEEIVDPETALHRTVEWELDHRTPDPSDSTEYAAEDAALGA